ncbi:MULTISPECIES: hypothetical protein [Myroides]|uniref:hypothetical protein n=1 Tax=Myroides TaxID=76831 RepID=UPI001324EC76|nr:MULTISPECIES: hypothetical protein [Myroides]MVX36676.1 hypothetical protein [Myroides sp. LoEW2-1]UVD80482.1 hypothetical protein NWE55_04215 [Myroides albus]
MKKALMLVCLIVLTISCKQKDSATAGTETADNVTEIVVSEKVNQLQSELLVPMEIVNAEATEVTAKYGLEFGGSCYACDVANIIVDGEMINLMNACDLHTQISYKITKIEEMDNVIVIHTPLNEFVFKRVDEYPVYQLTVKGQEIDQKLYRPAGFYTLKSLLESFEVHDCGDFEG